MGGKQPQSSSVSVAPASDYMRPVGAHAQDGTISAATTLTKPAGASQLFLQALTQNVRFTLDGTTPTASLGFQLAAGDYIVLPVETAVKVIEESATASIEYQWLA